MDYKIIYSETTELDRTMKSVEQIVNDLLSQGWKPQGGIHASIETILDNKTGENKYWYLVTQAVVRE